VVMTASRPSIAPSQVIAGPAVEPHTLAVLTGDNVQPQLLGWRGRGIGGGGMAE
jgi:hypothetical protein